MSLPPLGNPYSSSKSSAVYGVYPQQRSTPYTANGSGGNDGAFTTVVAAAAATPPPVGAQVSPPPAAALPSMSAYSSNYNGGVASFFPSPPGLTDNAPETVNSNNISSNNYNVSRNWSDNFIGAHGSSSPPPKKPPLTTTTGPAMSSSFTQAMAHNSGASTAAATATGPLNYLRALSPMQQQQQQLELLERQRQQQIRAESLLLWCKPQQQVIFREWYIYHYCNDRNVRYLDKLQRLWYPFRKLITLYFKLWSFTGEAEFYTMFIPMLVWLGTPLDAIQVGSMLCMGQYVTGTMKDAVCCPRPPCPPLELRGKRETHDREYGFPSTHASHSTVFAYFLYCELVRFFPEHAFTCWLIAVFYWVNVCLSRLYLGMHWLGDLIGGWAVAFLCILFHASFVDRWEAQMLSLDSPPWYMYVLVYIALHVLAITHATPHDPCPCYVDSLRFAGVLLGTIYGFWLFKTQYGTLTARPRPASLYDEAFSWTFFKQWIVCLVLLVLGKELSSVIAGKLLKVVFKFLAGTYASAVPRPLRRPYLAMARLVGKTTRGNERGCTRYYPITANSSFAGISMRDVVNPSSLAAGGGRTTTTAVPMNGGLPGSATSRSLVPNGSGRNHNSNNTTMMEGREGSMIEEPDGYLNSQQVWSLRTHEHWWLWEVHTRTVSYAVTGLFIAYVCPVMLREYFEVGKGTATAVAAGVVNQVLTTVAAPSVAPVENL